MVLNSGSFSVSGAASDANGVQWVDVKVDGGSWIDTSGADSWSYAVTGLADGSHTIYARAVDNAGNIGEVSVIVTVQTEFTITVTQGANGVIAPGTTVVNYGDRQVFSITPATGYHTVDVQVGGVSQGPVSSYTFSDVTAGGSITATFAINTYNYCHSGR